MSRDPGAEETYDLHRGSARRIPTVGRYATPGHRRPGRQSPDTSVRGRPGAQDRGSKRFGGPLLQPPDPSAICP
jgi:hypothetical protein